MDGRDIGPRCSMAVVAASFEDGNLLSKGKHFQGSIGARAEEHPDSRKETEDQVEHETSV
jgi:hypothetical protein